MNTINVSTPSNLTNSKFTNEIKSSFLVADILNKKASNNSTPEDDDDEKIDVEDDLDLKNSKSDDALNLTSNDKKTSRSRSSSVDLNQHLNQHLNQLNNQTPLNQMNSLNQLHKLNELSQLNQLNQLNPLLQNSEQQKNESLLSIYSRLFDPKQLNQNLLANLNQTKNELNKKTTNLLNSQSSSLPNLANIASSEQLTNSISNLINKTIPLNENQLTNATGKLNFTSLFNTHPHLFAQSLEAMATESGSSFANIQNLAQLTAQNFPHLNYQQNLMPSTSKLVNPLEQLRTNISNINNQHLQQLKELKNKQLILPNQQNPIDLIKQLSQHKMQNQFIDDAKSDKNTLSFPSNPLLFNSALSQVYNRSLGEQDPETLSKLCSNVELQQLIYQQHLQSQLQKQAFQYPLQQNGSLKFSNKDGEQEIQNSQNYLMNSFLANQGNKHVNNNFNNHQNEDDNEGISRTDSPASSHSSAIVPFNNNENSVQMTTFYPTMDYTYVCHSKQLQRKRTVFTLYQRNQLEETFNEKKYINKQDRVLLAKKIGLNDSQIKVWFINRRTKFRNLNSIRKRET